MVPTVNQAGLAHWWPPAQGLAITWSEEARRPTHKPRSDRSTGEVWEKSDEN